MKVLEKAQKMIEKYSLCDNCLGRQFAMLSYGISNEERGKVIKQALLMEAHRLALADDEKGIVMLKALMINGGLHIAGEILKRLGKEVISESLQCHICEGKFQIIDELVREVVNKLSEYEYSTFLIGIELPSEVDEKEDELKAEFEIIYGEDLRNEFSREIGKRVAEVVKKPVDLKKPNVVVLVNPFIAQVKVQANPLYISGRYLKLVRGIPQSKWVCVKCKGSGCPRCNWTGRMYLESVAELISIPMLKATDGEGFAFHASGREDVDARTLGLGRPFVVEVKRPRKRFLDLTELERTINENARGKVEVHCLKSVDKSAVRMIKSLDVVEKTYRTIVELDREVSDEELAQLEKALMNCKILQRTPLRVLHRRADLIRERLVYEAKVKRLSLNKAEMIIKCQGGLYVKELITGDEGRTKPSVSEMLKAKVVPISLDVLSVGSKDVP